MEQTYTLRPLRTSRTLSQLRLVVIAMKRILQMVKETVLKQPAVGPAEHRHLQLPFCYMSTGT